MNIAPPVAAPPLSLTRAEQVIWFLIGCLPFCNVARLPPYPPFWAEWAAATLFLFWLAVRAPRPGSRLNVPRAAFGLLAIAGLIILQVALRMGAFPIELLLAGATLGLAFWVACRARAELDAGFRAALLDAFAAGVVTALVLNGLAVAALLGGQEFLLFRLWPATPPSRAVGLIGQSNHLATLSALALASGLYLHARARLPGWALWLLIGVAALVCATSGSRVGLLAWGLCLLLVVVFQQRPVAAWSREGPLRLTRGGLAGVALVFVVAQAAWLLRAAEVGGSVTALRAGTAGRGGMVWDAVRLWIDHPWLGVGQGNYAQARLFELDGTLYTTRATHAHNLFAQALAEWGTPGVVLVVALTVYLLLMCWRAIARPERRPEDLLVVSFLVVLLGHSMVEHPLWFNYFLLPFALMLGLLPQPAVAVGAAPGRAGRVFAGFALLLCAGAAWNYQRIEGLAVRILAAAKPGVDRRILVSFPEALAATSLSAAPRAAQTMLARAVPLNDELIDAKLEMVTLAMKGIPNEETIARFVAFSVLAGQPEAAERMLLKVRSRNPGLYDQVLALLDKFAALDPRVAAFAARQPRPAPAP